MDSDSCPNTRDSTIKFENHIALTIDLFMSYLLPWRIPWSEEPGGLQSVGSQRVRHD